MAPRIKTNTTLPADNALLIALSPAQELTLSSTPSWGDPDETVTHRGSGTEAATASAVLDTINRNKRRLTVAQDYPSTAAYTALLYPACLHLPLGALHRANRRPQGDRAGLGREASAGIEPAMRVLQF